MSTASLLRLTLFTRANCSLCMTAKQALKTVYDRRPFMFTEIDVMAPDHAKWKVYEFDTPVVHVDMLGSVSQGGETTLEARKLMHRFKEAEIEKVMDEVEHQAPATKAA